MTQTFATTVFRKYLRIAVEFLVVGSCAVAFGVTMQVFLFSLIKSESVGTRDFSVYWATGQQLARHANPYDPAGLLRTELALGFPASMGVKYMRNPPWTLPVVWPLGWMTVKAASICWSLMLLACLVASVRLIWMLHGRPGNNRDWLGYSFAPAILCLILGQTSIFALLGLVLFLHLHRTSPFLAGCSLWLCTMKPHLFLPFGVVLLLWVAVSKNYRILTGAVSAIGLSLVITALLDPAAWSQYLGMIHSSGIELDYIPCLSFLLRNWISPASWWIQYMPAALGCAWAIRYFWPRRATWDWGGDGSPLMLVSVLVAPYCWLFDQALVIPALLQGAYRTRSRDTLLALAFASALIEGAFFANGRVPSAIYLWTMWTAPFWLVWYLYTTAKARLSADTGASA